MGILTTLFAAGAVGGASASLPKTDGSVSPGISPVDLDYNLIPMLVKKEDGKLIFSDCPEYADNYGILYEGTVEKGRAASIITTSMRRGSLPASLCMPRVIKSRISQ